MDVAMLLVSIICLMVPYNSLGAFSFDNITVSEEEFCDGFSGPSSNIILLWNYSTNETVTVIEWYRQPGVLIARIFGVNTGAPFTVLPPYNAAPYTVTQLNTTEYNAGINITGLSASDTGVYSVNVTAASPQSSTQFRNITPALNETPVVTCNPRTCTAPGSAYKVTTVWTKHGDVNRCTLEGGNAACSSEIFYDECRNSKTDDIKDRVFDLDTSCYYCLLALLLVFMVTTIVQLVLLLVIKSKKTDIVGLICFFYHHVLVLPLFGWLSFIPRLSKEGRFKMKNLDYSFRDKIMINVCTTVGVVLILIMQFVDWSDNCEAGIKFGICMLVSILCCGFAVLIMILRYFSGCEECGDFKYFCKHEPTKGNKKVNKVLPIFSTCEYTPKTEDMNPVLTLNIDRNMRNNSLAPLATGIHSNRDADKSRRMNIGELSEKKNEKEEEIGAQRKNRKKKKQKPAETENNDKTQSFNFDVDQNMSNSPPLATSIRNNNSEIVSVKRNVEYQRQIMDDQQDTLEENYIEKSRPRKKKKKKRKNNQTPENADNNDQIPSSSLDESPSDSDA